MVDERGQYKNLVKKAPLPKEKGYERLSKLQTQIQQGRKSVSGLFDKARGIKAQRRQLARTATGVRKLLGYDSLTGGSRGRGRPSGTYKYGVPIQVAKKLQAQQRALYQQYQQSQSQQLQGQGLSPQQINQIRYVKALQSQGQMPVQASTSGPIDTVQSVVRPVEDELAFTKFRADKTISPNTQNMLRELRRIQLKGQTDNIETQRRLHERRMFSDAGNLLKTPFIFNNANIDFTGVSSDNPLMAENIWTQQRSQHILSQTKPSILQTLEGGNNLRFF